jgi:hypothetical protein
MQEVPPFIGPSVLCPCMAYAGGLTAWRQNNCPSHLRQQHCQVVLAEPETCFSHKHLLVLHQRFKRAQRHHTDGIVAQTAYWAGRGRAVLQTLPV